MSELLKVPRSIPLEERELIAAMMAADLMGEAPQVEAEDMPSMVLHSLFHSKTWSDAWEMTEKRPELLPETLRQTLPGVLEAVEEGLAGLDWSELTEEERRRTEEMLERLLDPLAARAHPLDLTTEQRQALLLVLRMLVRALDRSLAALIDALRQDAEVLSCLEGMLPGQGWDMHRVGLHRKTLGNLERYATILHNHHDVDRLKELLGRMEGERSKRYVSVTQSLSETHSLRFSGDVQRMLPQEIVNLADERLKLLFYARMCERRLLTYQLRGCDYMDRDRRRGSVVALLDSSGSMSGELELVAKALLLALARKLMEERRPLRALLFFVDVHSYDLTSAEGSPQFLDFLCHTFGGGTDFDVALRQGIKCLEEPDWQGADILFITDGLARIKDRGCLHDWNCLKERQGSRIFTVIVDGTDPGGLQKISDHVFRMSRQGEWCGGSLLKELTVQTRSAGSCWVTQ